MLHAHVFSHDSAAHALGLAFLSPRQPFVHITRPHVDGSRHQFGVKHHTARYEEQQVITVGSMSVLNPARTAIDIARQHGLRTGVSACDSALRLGASHDQLREAAAPMMNWRGVRTAREAIDLADPGAENPAESLARLLVIETGFGRPRTQFPVRIGGRVVWCDLLVGPQVVEFDGRVKYLPTSRGGVASQDPSDVVWAERERERALIRAGLGVSRLVWDDLRPSNWERSRQRLVREINETIRLRGFATPTHLVAEAQRLEAERQRRLFGQRRPV